jgi:hypothetical protein
VSTLARWILMALASALAGAAARFFEGSCPLDGASWVCAHWEIVVTIASFVLGAFGVQVKRRGLAASKAAQRASPPPAPEPATSGEIEIPTRTSEEIETDNQRGDGGG